MFIVSNANNGGDVSKSDFLHYAMRSDCDDGLGGGERHASTSMCINAISKEQKPSWLDERFMPTPKTNMESEYPGWSGTMSPLGWIAKEVLLNGRNDLFFLTKTLLEKGADPNADAFDGETALGMAVRWLVNESVSARQTDDGFSTRRPGPLSKRGKTDANAIKWIKLVIEHGGKFRDLTENGLTPYIVCAFGKGDTKAFAKLLSENGVRTDVGGDGKTAWERMAREAALVNTKVDKERMFGILDYMAGAPCNLDDSSNDAKTLRARLSGIASDRFILSNANKHGKEAIEHLAQCISTLDANNLKWRKPILATRKLHECA